MVKTPNKNICAKSKTHMIFLNKGEKLPECRDQGTLRIASSPRNRASHVKECGTTN